MYNVYYAREAARRAGRSPKIWRQYTWKCERPNVVSMMNGTLCRAQLLNQRLTFIHHRRISTVAAAVSHAITYKGQRCLLFHP